MGDADIEAENQALRDKIASLIKKEAVVEARAAAQVDKLARENEAAEAQLDELKTYAEALSKEIVSMVAALEKTKADNKADSKSPEPNSSKPSRSRSPPGTLRRRGTLLSMGKNRASGQVSPMSMRREPSGESPLSPKRRPSEPSIRAPHMSSNDAVPVPLPTGSSNSRPPEPTRQPSLMQRMTRADSLPAFANPPPIHGRSQRESGTQRQGSKLQSLLGAQVLEMRPEPGLVLMRDKDTDAVLIRGGELEVLIDKLLEEKSEGKAYEDSFLITYRSFLEPQALFDALVKRYADALDDPNDSAAQSRVRLKILSFFRQWVDKQYHDWEEMPDMFEQYRQWLTGDVMGAQAKVAQQLLSAAEKVTQRAHNKGVGNQFDEPTPKPIRPPSGFTRVIDIDPTELARQMCLVESRLFQEIKPKEFLGKGWESKNKEVVAPNLAAFIAHFNRMSSWVATTIFEMPDERKRTSLVEHWIKVSDKLLDLNNFNGVMELIGGLGSTSVIRLKKTWAGVSRSKTKTWDRVRAVMAPQASFSSYRAAIRTAHPPVIPYLGVFMSDMVFIEDGNPDFLKDHPEMVNFHKRRLLADIIKDIQQHVQAPFNLEPVDEIIDFIATAPAEKEAVLYEKSLQIQPRQAE